MLYRNAGWAQTLASVSAAEASRPIAPRGTSIAAQTAHAAYYLKVFEGTILDRHLTPDWPGSFQPSEVDEQGWEDQRERLFAVAERVAELMRRNPQWQREHLGGAMGNLTQLAYHLGAVRQMLRLVKDGTHPTRSTRPFHLAVVNET